MSKVFKGRAVLPGSSEGQALVTRTGFNAYASFFDSLHENAEVAVCVDIGNIDLYGKRLDGCVLCLPNTTGSTSAGAVWQRVAELGIAPKAILFSQPIDPMAAGGLIIADHWAGKRIVTIDQLGETFLTSVQDGDWVVIKDDGTVSISNEMDLP